MQGILQPYLQLGALVNPQQTTILFVISFFFNTIFGSTLTEQLVPAIYLRIWHVCEHL